MTHIARRVTVIFYPSVPKQTVMARDHPVSRRTAVKLAGAAASTALVAGCTGNGDDDDDNDEDEGIEVDPDETILLEGITAGWEGLEPSQIETEENPTLILQEGETYEIGWVQGDGANHNIVIWDENEDVVEDYYLYDSEEDDTTDPDEDGDFMEFEVTEDVHYYRCFPHPGMQGRIIVE